MKLARGSRWSLGALLLVVAVGIGACSKSDNGPAGPAPQKELNSGDIAPGQAFAHPFTTAGSYPYHCNYHGAMTGTVTVSNAATDTLVALNFPGSSSPFPPATVKTGGKVTWTNGTGMTHTVTSN